MFRYLRCVVLLLTVAFSMQLAHAQPPMKADDDTLTKALVGTWITPPDSPDNADIPAKEVFGSDGVYGMYQYGDYACTRLARVTTAKWRIDGGFLITSMPDGSIIKDEIISLDATKAILRSVDDGQTYSRVKSTSCPTATDKRLKFRDLVGRWEELSSTDGSYIEFQTDGWLLMKRGALMGGKSTDDISLKFRLDESKTPVWIDLIVAATDGRELGSVKSIVEFVKPGLIRMAIPNDPDIIRPEAFVKSQNIDIFTFIRKY